MRQIEQIRRRGAGWARPLLAFGGFLVAVPLYAQQASGVDLNPYLDAPSGFQIVVGGKIFSSVDLDVEGGSVSTDGSLSGLNLGMILGDGAFEISIARLKGDLDQPSGGGG